jgi:TonB-linked SusC/RagA family outer membrane protein
MYKKFTENLYQPPGWCKQLLLVMKLTCLFLFIVMMQVSAAGFAQKLTLNQRQITISQLFREIRKQTGYNVIWEPDKLNGTAKVDGRFNNSDLNVVMGRCLNGTDLSYAIEDQTIVIKQKTATTQAEKGKTPKLTGSVKSEKGEPLVGATVSIRKLNISAITDAQGSFTFGEIPAGRYEVEATYIGFEKYTSTVNLRDDDIKLSISIKQTSSVLDETVVKGYYSTTKRLNTGDISTVKADVLERQAVTDPILALEGLVPGLFIQQQSGLPGGGVSVQIRGKNSISTGQNPLYIIDGVPLYSATEIGDGYGFGTPNIGPDPLALINPQDIESIEILKDADATSIYGSRGANGVILITTKKGKSGKAKLNVNAYAGMGKIARKLPVLNTARYLDIRRKAFANDGITPTADNAPDLLQWSQTDNNDYQKILMGGTSHLTEINSSISGGDKLTTFLIGGTYHYETSVQPGDTHYKRGAVNMKVNHTSEDGKLKVDLTTLYSGDNNIIYGTDYTATAISLPPNYPLYGNDGQLYWGGGITNPMGTLKNSYSANQDNLVLNATISYNILHKLQIKASVGENKNESDQKMLYPGSGYNPAYTAASTGQYSNNVSKTYNIEPQIDYNTAIAKGKLNATVGGTWLYNQWKEPFFVVASNFPSEALLDNYTSAGTYFLQYSSSSAYKYASVFGRLSYVWDDRYVLNGTFRRDGSSRFGPDSRFGDFGSIGAAWIFSDEAFLKKSTWLSFGKLRGSYGTVGNDQISGNYNYLSTYGSNGYTYGSSPAFTANNIANPNFGWETTKKLELALELGFLNNRIMFNGALFHDHSDNLLVTTPLSPQSGFASYTANLNAVVQNRGVELEIKAIPIDSKDFNWNTSFNFSAYRNKLASYPGIDAASLVNTYYNYIVGQPLNLVGLYHFTGFKNGQATVEDVNHDGVISPGLAANGQGDYVSAGSRDPKFYGGFSNSLRYKRFQLDFLFNFVKQKNFSVTSFPGLMANQSRDVLNSGFTPSTQASSASYNSYVNYYAFSDAAFTDASFIRLKNLSLSYNFGDKVKKALGMANCRVYIRGQNLLTFTRYKGLDPETYVTQGSNNAYFGFTANTPSTPTLRTLTAGIQFSY